MHEIIEQVRRLAVLSSHVQNVNRNMCSSGATATSVRAPTISVNPKFSLVDEKIKIRLTGLASNQIVTFVADVRENGSVFESRCVYRADDSGVVDNCTSESLDGTFKGVEQMGLFWSLKSVGARVAMRLVKKDVTRPMEFTIRVFDGNQAEAPEISSDPLSETVVHRTFMAPDVKRLPLREGRFRGTETFEWFSGLEYIDASRLGAVGLCFGGFLSLGLTSILPQIKAVVNINGTCITLGENTRELENEWLRTDHTDKIEVIRYPDTGHLIEPPHMPFIRAIDAGGKRMLTINFIPKQFKDQKLMSGGHMVAHSHAQEDAWQRILDFLHTHLGPGHGS
ncbi:BAAT-like protein [Mya arenaria]|uniref:BAAT-like protein n=1 Tax=Mya arenaria TaxID=6604 RepID=A0ABY7EL73_MYAAR|nr:BAAT-like protein [Mya arenaria]